jgi:phage shock protein PspC (stress-responsive transcriptional regulator)
MSTSATASSPRALEIDRAVPEAPREWWVIGGVAAEVGERLAVPVGFIRVLLLLGSFAQGDVILAYALAALLLPRAGARRPSAANVIAVARVGIAFCLGWGLVGGGLSLGQPGLFDQGPAVWITQCGVCLAGLLALFATGVPAAERDPGRDRQTVRCAAPLVGLLAAVGLGVVFVPGVRWDRVLASLAILAGIAVILPGRRGRAGALVVPAGLLAAATLLLVAAGTRLDGGVGNARVTPDAAAAIPSAYRRAIGDLTIDLTGLRPSSAVVVVRASVGIGTLIVNMPVDAEASVVEQVGRGQLDGPSSPRYGLDLRRTALARARDSHSGRTLVGRPRLRLRILASVGIGRLEIDQVDQNSFGGV